MSLNWLILFILLTAIIILAVDLIIRFYNLKFYKTAQYKFLEIKPPASSIKTPLATEQLFGIIHALLMPVSTKDRLLGRVNSVSLEITSDKDNGIRFLLRVPGKLLDNLKQQLVSYLPDIKLKLVNDYLPKHPEDKFISLNEYKQTRHYGYPLATQDMLTQHDPITYLISTITRQKTGEVTAFQLVLSPSHLRETQKIRNQLYAGNEPSLGHGKRSFIIKLLILIIKIPVVVLKSVLMFFSELDGQYTSNTVNKPISEDRLPSRQKQELYQAIHNKLSQPLFTAKIRTYIASNDSEGVRLRQAGIQAALGTLTVAGFQSLAPRQSIFKKLRTKIWLFDGFKYRLPFIFKHDANILSVSEVASLYHFPARSDIVTENLSKNLSSSLPAPSILKSLASSGGFDVILGQNEYHGNITSIGLTELERERHVYIIGGTGSGKTTLLQYALVQDIKNGKGIAVVDPHGDLAETLLKYVPKPRIKDVIYFNPRDISHPIGLNLLEQPKGLSEDELLLEQDFITESVVSIFRKIFSDDDSGGHRIEHFLRNAIHTAFTVPDATLFTVYKLLTNTKYRRAVVDKLEDQDLVDFWKGEFNKAGDYQKVKMSSGVNAKIGRFQRSAVSRRILEQSKSTIDFDDIIQNKKILICNFSKGHIGEDTSALLGISVLTKLQLAALRRTRLGQDKRTPFYLYVDEFQNFATTSFVQLLSEARKYKLFLTMAEQSTSQQDEKRLIEIILANVGSVICFRSGSPADERMILPLFSPYVAKGEIANLDAFNFYIKLAGISSKEPFSGRTILLKDKGSWETENKIVEYTRKNYSANIKPTVKGIHSKLKTIQTATKSAKAKLPGE